MSQLFSERREPNHDEFYQDVADIRFFSESILSRVTALSCQTIGEDCTIYAKFGDEILRFESQIGEFLPLSRTLEEKVQLNSLFRSPQVSRQSAMEALYSLEAEVRKSIPIQQGITCAAKIGDAIWIGTEQGAMRWSMNVGWRYFAGSRWLPDDRVHTILEDGSGRVCIGAETGVSFITPILLSFDAKADIFEKQISERHSRNGFVTVCRIENPGDLASFLPIATDNDGLWTALYIWAESLRFSVTKSDEARELAAKSMKALLSLVSVTGIPGFPARATVGKEERVELSDPNSNWLPSPVEPGILYKEDTSSDELAGHYLAWYVFSEMASTNEERTQIAETCRAVTKHILEHDLMLIGPSGIRTSWGVWTPKYLNDDPEWRWERGLNSLEILSHLKVAHHLCGDAEFETAYRTLIHEHHYAENAIEQKVRPPTGENNHSDDELAACAYFPLLMLEDDSELRSIYLRSLERTHSFLRAEGSPLYNYLYTALTGKSEMIEERASQSWLRETPLDLRHWKMRNQHRADVLIDPEPGRFGEIQLKEPLSPAERHIIKWNSNPYEADGGSGGDIEEDAAFWLLAYWLGEWTKMKLRTNSQAIMPT